MEAQALTAPVSPINRDTRIAFALSAIKTDAEAFAKAAKIPAREERADDIELALDDIGDLHRTLLDVFAVLADALDANRTDVREYLSDLITRGFEAPLNRRLRELEEDCPGVADPHRDDRLSAAQLGIGRR